MEDFVEVAKVGEVPLGGLKQVALGNQWIALANVGGQIYAVSDVCTHVECWLLEEGSLAGDVLECSCHGSQFDVKTGAVMSGPAEDPLPVFDVRTDGEKVFVRRA